MPAKQASAATLAAAALAAEPCGVPTADGADSAAASTRQGFAVTVAVPNGFSAAGTRPRSTCEAVEERLFGSLLASEARAAAREAVNIS